MLGIATKKQYVLRGVCIGLFIGAALWVVLLLQTATALRHAGSHAQKPVRFGFLTLNQITKEPAPGGHQVSFSFESGLMGYMLLWATSGVIGGAAVTIYRRPHQPL